jgi:hypothetical protein
MSNTACSQQNLNVKHVATLFEEVQNRYVSKLTSIDEKHIAADERHKVNHLALIKKIFFFFVYLSMRREKKGGLLLIWEIHSQIEVLCR